MLKQLILQKKIDTLRASMTKLQTREAEILEQTSELENALTEAKTDEEIELVEQKAEELEQAGAELQEQKTKLEEDIRALEEELSALNSKVPETENRSKAEETNIINREEQRMNYRFFRNMSRETLDNMMEREEVKAFVKTTRDLMESKRAVTGADLTIPKVLLEVLRDTLNVYSKLISKVNVRAVKGQARQNIVGAIPEGIWTEACGKLNELSIVFNQIQVDGYKVGGFIAICNATLKDSDLNLADEIMYAIAQAIGLAVDKAILYGTGAKMPVGIVTRLAEIAEPAYYGDNERTWTDLHTSNLLVISSAATTPEAFYADLVSKLGIVESAYSDGNLFWAMSSKTYRTLQAKALSINATGAIVSGQNKVMPIIGGDIVELDFIPDNVIIGGYGSLYLLAEREGVTLAMSEHVQFIEDNTVFKGIARYDGRPIFGEAFVALNIAQTQGAVAPVANAVTFAPDTANF